MKQEAKAAQPEVKPAAEENPVREWARTVSQAPTVSFLVTHRGWQHGLNAHAEKWTQWRCLVLRGRSQVSCCGSRAARRML